MAKDIYEFHKIFKDAGLNGNSYAEKHGIDFVSTIFTLLIIGLLIVYFYYKGQTNRYKYGVDSSGNSIWSKERCKPHILPISGNLVKEPGMTAYETTYKNFKECSKEGHRKGVMNFINPLYIISGGISSLFTIIISITRSFKNMISMVTDYLLNLFKVSKYELDNIQSEITRSLNYHIFSKIKESTKSLEYMYRYLFTSASFNSSIANFELITGTVFNYVYRALFLIFGEAAADALQSESIMLIVLGIPLLAAGGLGAILIAWGALKIENELYPLEKHLLEESIYVQNQFDILKQQKYRDSNGNIRSYPLIPPAFGASNEMDQAYCLFYGAPVREMNPAERDKEIESKRSGKRFYEWHKQQIKVKFHRNRGNINALQGIRRLNIDEIVEHEEEILLALASKLKLFSRIRAKMQSKLKKFENASKDQKQNEDWLDEVKVWNVDGKNGSTMQQLKEGIKSVEKQIDSICKALPLWIDDGYINKLKIDPDEYEFAYDKLKNAKPVGYSRYLGQSGNGVTDENYKYSGPKYWPSKFYNIFGKDQIIAIEIGESQREGKEYPNREEKPLDQTPGADTDDNDGKSVKWTVTGKISAQENFNRIKNTLKELEKFGSENTGESEFNGFSNSMLIPYENNDKYEVIIIGTKPYGKDIGFSLWQNAVNDEKKYAPSPELPWRGDLNGKNMTSDKDGMGNLALSDKYYGKGWGGPNFEYQLCKTRHERYRHWRSGNFGSSYGTKLKIQVMDSNSAKIQSTKGPGSYAGGIIKFDMIKWEIDLYRLQKFDDFADNGTFHTRYQKDSTNGLDVHYLSDEHLNIINNSIRNLSISKWESIRDNGGLGYKNKDKYTKSDAWGNTVWMFGNEPPGIYQNSWSLRTDSMIRDYPEINWWSITDGTGKSNSSDVTNKFWFKNLGYTDADAGWFGVGHNNHYMWDNQGRKGGTNMEKIDLGIFKDTYFLKQEGDKPKYLWLQKYFIDTKVSENLFNDDAASNHINLNDLKAKHIPRGVNEIKYTLSQLSGRDKNKMPDGNAPHMSSGNGGLGGWGILKKSHLWKWPFLATVTDVNPLRETFHMPNFTLYANVTAACFGKNTKIPLINNKIVNIQDLKLGDILEDGSKVTALTKANVDDGGYGIIYLYEINNVIVSGKHKIEMPDGTLINAIDHPDAKEYLNYNHKYIYCFNNESKRIKLNGINYCDWDEVSSQEIMYLNSFKYDEAIGIDTPTTENKSNKICPIIHDKLESGFHPNTEIKLKTGCLVPIKKIKIGDKLFDDSFVKAIIKVKIDDIDLYKHTIYGRTFYGTNNLIYTTDCKYSKDGLTTTSTYYQHDREFKEKWIPNHKQQCFYNLITNTGYISINDVQFSHYNQNLEKFLPENLYFE